MNNNYFFFKLLIAILFSILATSYYAEDSEPTASNNIFTSSTRVYENHFPLFINYKQKNTNSFSITYRLPTPSQIPSATIKLNKEDSIKSITNLVYPKEGDSTAVLFLIDISDPRRQKIINKNISQIIHIIQSSKKHHKFGLASFAENINILAPLGSSKEYVISKAQTLKAIGSETLLYQYIGEAIKKLNQYKASRRVLIVFSDGKAEDLKDVYNHEYIIKKALEKNIIIDGMAFPPKAKKENISYYQSLERLSSETGGVFVKATPDGDIQNFNISKLLKQSDNGGYWEFDIQPRPKLSGKVKAILNISLGDKKEKNIPISLTLPSLPLPPKKHEKPPKKINNLRYYLSYGLPLLLLLGVGLVLFIFKKRPKVLYATLDILDGNDKYSIYNKTFKIGRNEENNLTLTSQTVSSFHAQIHLNRKKQFIITDLQSINGTLVNDENITTVILKNNDLIEIGEVRFKFVTDINSTQS